MSEASMANEQLINEMVDALASILNVEGAAMAGAHLVTVWKGLDVPQHFDKVRAALKLAEQNGFSIK
jgi:hypothetical protein